MTISASVSGDEISPRRTDTPIVSSLGREPWNHPWWKTADGDGATLYYILAIHLLAAVGLVLFPAPGWRVVVATVALAWVGGLGVTVCYHRTLAHTALRLHPDCRASCRQSGRSPGTSR